MARISIYPKEAGIYKLTNNVNGKIYIGKTIDFRDRMIRHKQTEKATFKYKSSLISAIKKYGWTSFKVDILYVYIFFDKTLKSDNDKLLQIESSYIRYHNSTDSKIGYNICTYSTDRTGVPLSDETKEKIRKANLGKIHTEETKQLLSDITSGVNHPMYGKHYDKEKLESRSGENSCWYGKSGKLHPTYGRTHTEEAKAIIKEERAKQDMSFKHKAVFQVDILSDEIIKIWNHAGEAEKELGIRASDIRAVCRGAKYAKTAGGFKWKFKIN